MYNMREKQFAKHLAKCCDASYQDILEDLEKGDMSETAKKVYFDCDIPACDYP